MEGLSSEKTFEENVTQIMFLIRKKKKRKRKREKEKKMKNRKERKKKKKREKEEKEMRDRKKKENLVQSFCPDRAGYEHVNIRPNV